MAKKENQKQEIQEIKVYVYAGLSVPQLMLRKGKVYKEIPKLPKEFEFLKEYFVELKDYPKFKLKNAENIKNLSPKIREALKAYQKKMEVK